VRYRLGGTFASIAGRDAELSAITRFLDSLVARPGIFVLEGEPGIGKTTLWLAAVEQARERGFQVLSCRPSAAEARLSYASLADVLTGACDSVAETLPVLQRRAIDFVLLRADNDGVVSDHRAAGAALLSVLNRLAGDMPVLLAIDDYQWVDTPSARVIEFAIRRLSARTGMLAALRTGELGGQEPWLRLSDPGRVQRVRVGPLSLGALHQMIHERTGRSFPRTALARIHQVSGSNPFFALELAGEAGRSGTGNLAAALPDTLAQLVQARIAGIHLDVQPALLAAAALAEPTAELIQLALGTDPMVAERLLGDAEEHGVITIDGHRIRFTHPLLAAGVYAAAPPADRRGMHRRLAEIATDPEERARHLAQAAIHLDAETTAALDEGAARARSRGPPPPPPNSLNWRSSLARTPPGAGSGSRSITSTPATLRAPARCWRKPWPGSLRARPGPKRCTCWPSCACMMTATGSRRATCSRHSVRRARICGCGCGS
jgi:AAA ATPase domain